MKTKELKNVAEIVSKVKQENKKNDILTAYSEAYGGERA